MGYVMRRLDPLTREALRALGEVLRELRAERGLSQRTLAWRSGVHQSTISRLETGKSEGFRIVALARVLAGLERGTAFDEAPWVEAATPGWRQMMAAFSTRGAFAKRLAADRRRARVALAKLMQPQASRRKYQRRRRTQNGT